MTTLAAVLVRQRALPLETVEQAMLRQSLFGGDLATNLLELGSIDEPSLLSATAAALEAPALANGRITGLTRELLNTFPAAQLLEYPFLPVSQTDSDVVVAVAAPLPHTVADDLTRRFAKPVVLRAALEIRIRQAIAAELGQTLDERTEKLLARLDGLASVNSQRAGAAVDPVTSVAPTPRVSLPAGRRSLLPLKRDSKTPGPARRLGPFTTAMAEIELASAQSPGDIIAIWLDFAAQYFDYTAIFAVQGDIAAGKAARGAGTVGEAFSRIGVPLELPSALQRVRSAATWQLIALEPRGLDRNLARDLCRPVGPQILLLPICIRQRVVLVTYGDHGEGDVLLDRVGDVLALQPLVERHLERLLVERKRGGKSLQPPAKIHSASAAISVPVRRPEQEPAPLPAVLDGGQTPDPEAEPTPLPKHPIAADPTPRESTVVESPTDLHESAASGAPILIGQEPDRDATSADGPSPTRSSVDTGFIDESWDLIQPVLSVGDSESSRPTRAATNNPSARLRDSSPPASVWPRSATRPGLSPKLQLVADSDSGEAASPFVAAIQESLLPGRRPESEPPAVPPVAPPVLQAPPTAPVSLVNPEDRDDLERQCQELFERFRGGDPSALDQLVALGDVAAELLVRDLPGPILVLSRAPRVDPSNRASDSGPLLKAIVAFGPIARPYVIARCSDPDPKVRVWATRLLGELIGQQSAITVAERIVADRDAEVRRAAYLASHQLLRDPDAAQALRQALLSTAADQKSVITQRLAAIDALADLRDAPAIVPLIELLADPNPGTAAAAQQALTVLARQDFGYDAKTWSSWWRTNAGRDRIEWVIDALDHRSPAIRQAASEELRLISRLYVGNFDDDSLEARAKMQKKYREWWAAGGRSPTGPIRV